MLQMFSAGLEPADFLLARCPGALPRLQPASPPPGSFGVSLPRVDGEAVDPGAPKLYQCQTAREIHAGGIVG